MKKKKGNALAHLEKFTAVQQLAIFAPDLTITVTQYNENQFFKASTFFRGRQIEAIHKGKKSARQALCSKIIKVIFFASDKVVTYASSNSNCSMSIEALVRPKV